MLILSIFRVRVPPYLLRVRLSSSDSCRFFRLPKVPCLSLFLSSRQVIATTTHCPKISDSQGGPLPIREEKTPNSPNCAPLALECHRLCMTSIAPCAYSLVIVITSLYLTKRVRTESKINRPKSWATLYSGEYPSEDEEENENTDNECKGYRSTLAGRLTASGKINQEPSRTMRKSWQR